MEFLEGGKQVLDQKKTVVADIRDHPELQNSHKVYEMNEGEVQEMYWRKINFLLKLNREKYMKYRPHDDPFTWP